MDKKKIIALAAGTLVAGTLSTQGLQAMTDYCNYGSGADVRSNLLQAEAATPVSVDDALADCAGGKCPRPKRPPEGKKASRYNWRTIMANAEEGGSDNGMDSDGDDDDDLYEEKDSGEGGCGEGTCGS